MRTVDVFSGCGGLSLGFEKAGYEVQMAFDAWKPAVETYRANFAHPSFLADMTDDSVFEQILALAPETIIGGPPCQDFSSAGKRDEHGGRGSLTLRFAELIRVAKPQCFLMENVDRIVKTQTYRRLLRLVVDAGYRFYETVLDAAYCGVPQHRKRYFLFGGTGDFQPNAVARYIEKNLSTEAMTPRKYLGSELKIENYYRHPRSYARRAVFSTDEPSPTIRGVNRPIPKGYPGHPGDSVPPNTPGLRPLTFYERMRIQSFPPEFVFVGTKTENEQMGNAVPPELAAFVARALTAGCTGEATNAFAPTLFATAD